MTFLLDVNLLFVLHQPLHPDYKHVSGMLMNTKILRAYLMDFSLPVVRFEMHGTDDSTPFCFLERNALRKIFVSVVGLAHMD